MMDYYRRDGTPIPETDHVKAAILWAKEFENEDRHVGSITIGHLYVSTVFLGLDHSFGGGPPLIFETMVFNQDPNSEEADLMCERYSTEAEALAGHEAVVLSIVNNTFRGYTGEVIDTTYQIMEEPTLI